MLLTTICTLALAASITAITSNSSSAYRKVEEYSGSSFFDGFDTFNLPDPTHGFVQYVDIDTAATDNLTAFIFHEAIDASNAYVSVDYQQRRLSNTSLGRNSVRLTSKNTFGVGLLTVIDVLHAPTGPGVWPAVWLLGNVTGVEWPNSGEMDIMEWVNDRTYNAMTLHTAPGCSVDSSQPGDYQGHMLTSNCNEQTGHLGCSIAAPPTAECENGSLATAGPAFNAQGGGVYVHEWTESGVSIWLFPRDRLPQDLSDEKPNPSNWTTKPLAKFSGSGCDFTRAFERQQLIINICLCGDWAGNQTLWDDTMRNTGSPTCVDYVAEHPESFKDAYFEFASIKMYSSNAEPPGKAGINKRDEDSSGIGHKHVAGSDDLSRDHPPHLPSDSRQQQHAAVAPLSPPDQSVPPFRMTNTTTVRATGTGTGRTISSTNSGTARLPSSSATVSTPSEASNIEVGAYIIAAFFTFGVAVVI